MDFDKIQDRILDDELTIFEKMELRAAIMPPLKDGIQQQPEEDDTLDGVGVCRQVPIKRYMYRRAYSEMELLDTFSTATLAPLPKGYTYNFMTRGDIDALSYLKLIIRQQNIHHAIVSTWCVDMNDIRTMKKWVDDGRIGKLDLYLGEIYTTGRHGLEAADFQAEFKGYDNVKVVVTRNHSKIMAGRGEKFTFVVQTSANINTNPRIENACIIVPEDPDADALFQFYEEFFQTVKTRNRTIQKDDND